MCGSPGSSADLRMETDVLLMPASLEGEGQWRDRRGPHAQDETSFSAFVNTGETVSAWIQMLSYKRMCAQAGVQRLLLHRGAS